MSLPYPRYNESHDAWMRRCDDWERNLNESRRQLALRCAAWNKGYPAKHGIERYEIPTYFLLPEGVVQVVRRGWGNKAAERVRTWAQKHGHGFALIYNANGCHGMYSRTDGVAYIIHPLESCVHNISFTHECPACDAPNNP